MTCAITIKLVSKKQKTNICCFFLYENQTASTVSS